MSPASVSSAPTRRWRLRRLAVPAVAVALLLSGCGEEGEEPDASASPTDSTTSGTPGGSPSPDATTSTPTPSTPPTGSPTPGETGQGTGEPVASRVYYLVDTRAGLRLAGETRDLAGANPATEAVEAMIAGPEDSDYTSTWNPRTKVVSVGQAGGVVNIELSPAARRADVGSQGAERMVQQLVYTVTEVLGRQAKVQLLIGGQPAGELWGAVRWDRPVGRANPDRVRMLVQIDTPPEGARVSSPVTVSGEANAFEANVPWRVLREDGTVVRRGFTTARDGMTFSPFRFTVRLPPGSYTVEVSEDDPSGGEGGTPMSDTKQVTVE